MFCLLQLLEASHFLWLISFFFPSSKSVPTDSYFSHCMSLALFPVFISFEGPRAYFSAMQKIQKSLTFRTPDV